jgi:hypothetical protein
VVYPELLVSGSHTADGMVADGDYGREMAKTRKKKTFDVVAVVKAASRKAIGTVPPTRRVEVDPKQKVKRTKRKPTLGELLGEE